jgi:hypothetical protein
MKKLLKMEVNMGNVAKLVMIKNNNNNIMKMIMKIKTNKKMSKMLKFKTISISHIIDTYNKIVIIYTKYQIKIFQLLYIKFICIILFGLLARFFICLCKY